MTIEICRKLYKDIGEKHQRARDVLRRGLTLTEKTLYSHMKLEEIKPYTRKESNVDLYPDRIAMQDATAQMAILQFISSGVPSVHVPTTVHCDHLILAHHGVSDDLPAAKMTNKEVYDFLASAAKKYGMGFWDPGAGIIHQVVLENYAFPGALLIGTDSHTPNGGGLGMLAIGVGGADAVDVMVGLPFGIKWPGVIGIKLTGKLSGWSSPKDVILRVMKELTVKGGTGSVVEYFGDGASSISCTGKATICNMGAEHGATTSTFPLDSKMLEYLRATDRSDIAILAEEYSEYFRADEEVYADPAKYYDKIVEINLTELEPLVCGPHTPDKVRSVSEFRDEIVKEDYPDNVKYALIGSCTNSSYEDMGRAAAVAKDAVVKGLKLSAPLLVTPGSNLIEDTIKRDGQMKALTDAGATELANACGPCIGQWKRTDIGEGERNTIVNSYNRNFRARNDGNKETLSFICSPELVTAYAFSGSLSFNPLKDKLKTVSGQEVMLEEPSAEELPSAGFTGCGKGYVPPEDDGSKVEIVINPESERLQVLAPFLPWDGNDFVDVPLLLKASGKCTTDHISPAGPWLKFRGHLDRISDNAFSGTVNAFDGSVGTGKNQFTGKRGIRFSDIARDYKERGVSWVVAGDENYGEGSSREHAAMSPRFLGAAAVIVRSFARIHETNLKKQGVLPLTFVNPADYEKFCEDDKVSITGLEGLAPGKNVSVKIKHSDGTEDSIETKHTMSDQQIEWFRTGSALNKIARDLEG
ncbi:aconitase [Candidatus Scalindua japonica]|uniref:Aconitate hydratase A n=1 Tax=Candidatus Scalindua japonica TaxID=1284222 RepID=A0A286U1N5_9BACT|nr:aconitate hydratase [Candidatus Scalindua japonica]GAX62035.1 aconitase [Candidatus Scalindua japonica]